MSAIPLGVLIGSLVFLIIVSGFFSGSETGLMSLNRYRLRHLARHKHAGAVRANRLLKTPERLIGLILLGNNLVNNLAVVIVTVIGLRLWGETSIFVATAVFTVVMLIIAEITPKTLAALNPERYAFPAAYILQPMLRICYPAVWLINLVVRGVFKLFGLSSDPQSHYDLSTEELRTVVNEAGALIPQRHQKMLLSILDLEKVTVEDIMIPRNEIVGIDCNDDWNTVISHITESQHTRLPVYEDDIDHVIGFVHLRHVLGLLETESLNKEDFLTVVDETYFIPEGTHLHTQLLNFQRERCRIGLVVDEYGDIQGLVTLEDILEEIVGEFTTDPANSIKDIHLQNDGSYLADGSISLRDLNRALHWDLPIDGPKTLNGMILEYLEDIPHPGTSLLLDDHPVEIVQTSKNTVKTVRIIPGQHPKRKQPDNQP